MDQNSDESEASDSREDIPAESLSQSCRLRMGKYFERIFTRKLLIPLGLGQVLSLMICVTAVTSGLLQELDVNIPTAQAFLNYTLLCLTCTVTLACRKDGDSLLTVLKRRGVIYFFLGLFDVQANYLVVKAYQYTSVTSVQLLDVFNIPTVILLSWLFLRVRYSPVHYIGVAVCVTGAIALVLVDVLVGRNSGSGSNALLGDMLVVISAICYALSNVLQEYICKRYSRLEFLGMLGIFGTVINGIQFSILERKEIRNIDWTNYKIVLLIVGFTTALYILYVLMPEVMVRTSATVVNLSLLSADFYALIAGIFIFKYKFHVLYFISFVAIVAGLAVYNIRPTRTVENRPACIEKLCFCLKKLCCDRISGESTLLFENSSNPQCVVNRRTNVQVDDPEQAKPAIAADTTSVS